MKEIATILFCSSSSTSIRATAQGGGHQDTTVVCCIRNDSFNSVSGCKSVADHVCVEDALVHLIDAEDLKLLKVSIP